MPADLTWSVMALMLISADDVFGWLINVAQALHNNAVPANLEP
jgi:hypothetical protein